MRIIFYLISILVFFSSCSKGGAVLDPQFGNVLIMNSSAEDIHITQGENEKTLQFINSTPVSIPSGMNKFRFYSENNLLLDTVLSVEPHTTHVYTIFKPANNAAIEIIDASFRGFNKEATPDQGYIKLSIANLSGSLPDKVSIDLSTMTYTPFSLKPIQVGQIQNVTSAFSEFHQVLLGTDQFSKVVNTFTLTIKDPVSNVVLGTVPLVLPVISNAGQDGNLSGSVYLIYLNNLNTATILMSK